MSDMSATTIAKSDQLNGDDLIGRSITVRITKVTVSVPTNGAGDQPVSVHYEGDNGKPYKPCKTMRRVLVGAWGNDSSAYVGRSLTLYRDDAVMFGGQAVGGIRIGAMSHITGPLTLSLAVKKGTKKPFVVQPLKADSTSATKAVEPPTKPTEPSANYIELSDFLDSCTTVADIEDWKVRANELRTTTPGIAHLRELMKERLAKIEAKPVSSTSLYADGNLPD